MIDLTQFDDSISLPPKFFKADARSETRLPAQLHLTTAPDNGKTARYNIFDAEDDNACLFGDNPEYGVFASDDFVGKIG
eukprot:4721157-Heterocapsa_arctica.AAC.1